MADILTRLQVEYERELTNLRARIRLLEAVAKAARRHLDLDMDAGLYDALEALDAGKEPDER